MELISLGIFAAFTIPYLIIKATNKKEVRPVDPALLKRPVTECAYSKTYMDDKVEEVLDSRARYLTSQFSRSLTTKERYNHLSANREWYTEKILMDPSYVIAPEDKMFLKELLSTDFKNWDDRVINKWNEVVVMVLDDNFAA